MTSPKDAWWEADDDHELAQGVRTVAEAILSDDNVRRQAIQVHGSLYANRPLLGLDFDAYWRGEGDDLVGSRMGSTQSDLTYNVIKSCVDTLTNRIAQHKPLPFFLSRDGDAGDQRRAKKMERFVEGQFDALKVFQKGRVAFRDACIYGTGLLKVHRVGDTFQVDRVPIHELHVPYEEAYYGTPRQMHHRMRINARQLAGTFPEFRDDILREARADGRRGEMVDVIESWHLPSVPHPEEADGGHDGVRAMCVGETCLMRVPWTHGYFPFCPIRFDEALHGFWGMGLTHSLRQIQVHLNEMVDVAQTCARRFGIPYVLLNRNAKPSNQKITNEIGQIFEVDSPTDITFAVSEGLPESVVAQRKELFETAFRLAGVSALSAQGKKPGGIDSAVALRELDDIESDRFALLQMAYEDLMIDVSVRLIDIARGMHAEGVDPEVRVRGKRFFESVRWSEVDLDDDKYVIGRFPINALSRTPAAKLQQVTDYMQAGLFDPTTAKRLLDFPDIEAVTSLETASIDDLMETFQGFLDGARYEAPEPFQDLEMGIRVANSIYLKERRQASQRALQKLRDWVEDATRMLGQAQGAGAPINPQPPQPGAPPANPGAQGPVPGAGPQGA